VPPVSSARSSLGALSIADVWCRSYVDGATAVDDRLGCRGPAAGSDRRREREERAARQAPGLCRDQHAVALRAQTRTRRGEIAA
jgi:hypothetical protein